MNVEVQREGNTPSHIGSDYYTFGRFGKGSTGHDVRFQLGPNNSPESFTFDGSYLPSPEISEQMFMRFEKGEGKRFENLPYEVEILDSDLFYCESDAVGNKSWKAKVYIAGHHDGFGYRNGHPWTGPEQIAFASVSVTPWKPGKTFARLIPSGVEHQEMEVIYKKLTNNKRMRDKVQQARLQIYRFRQERNREEASAVADSTEVVLLDVADVKHENSLSSPAD